MSQEVLKSTSSTQESAESAVSRNFMALLKERWVGANTLLCVGLDSEYAKLPEAVRGEFPSSDKGAAVFEFNKQVIDATADLICAYKPQYAFYGALGESGISALRKTVAYIHDKHPGIPVILDGKRNDIGNTAEQYAVEVFDVYGADAVTVNPYLGYDGVEPFLKRPNKGAIVLCRTSNKSAPDFQDRIDRETGLPIYQLVAKTAAQKWNSNGNLSLVMGCTYPEEMKIVREIVGDNVPFLVPGLGAQGGKPEDLPNGFDGQKTGIIANSSRGIIFASQGQDFAEAARREALKLRDAINVYR